MAKALVQVVKRNFQKCGVLGVSVPTFPGVIEQLSHCKSRLGPSFRNHRLQAYCILGVDLLPGVELQRTYISTNIFMPKPNHC